MTAGFAAGALLGHVYAVAGGIRIRLRMVQGADLQAIRRLLEREGESELSASRFVYFNPREEYVLCATALVDGHEVLLGLGVIELDHGTAVPELRIADGEAQEDVRKLLTSALTDTARAISRSRAA